MDKIFFLRLVSIEKEGGQGPLRLEHVTLASVPIGHGVPLEKFQIFKYFDNYNRSMMMRSRINNNNFENNNFNKLLTV